MTRRLNKKPNAAIEDRTAILPYVVADCVLGELERYFGGAPFADRDAIAEKLYETAQACYQNSESFAKKINSRGLTTGRDWLYCFMRHWLTREMKVRHFSMYTKLPSRYCAGEPINPEARADKN